MDTAACWGISRCRPRSGILRFRSVKIQSMTRKLKRYGQCHHCFYLQLVWQEEFGSGLSKKFDVNKAFTAELISFSFILCSISYMYRERTSVSAKSALIGVCWHLIKFVCTRHKHLHDSYWLWFRMLIWAYCSMLPSWESHRLLFRKGVDSVDSSLEQLCSQASARKQMCDVPYP